MAPREVVGGELRIKSVHEGVGPKHVGSHLKGGSRVKCQIMSSTCPGSSTRVGTPQPPKCTSLYDAIMSVFLAYKGQSGQRAMTTLST